MRKQLKSLLLVALFASTTLPAWSQASTQGKEFWVSSTLVCSPNKATPTPYIAISAEKACTVKIEGGVGNAINITQEVAAGSWNEFGHNANAEQRNPAVGMINVHMDASKWYPTSMSDASQVRTLAGQKNMYGLHITATANVSVYVILSSTNSMDASNILPVTALGSEYYTQDYWPIVKSDFDNTVSMVTILATEDGTKVDITPRGNTYDNHPNGQLYTVELNKGQTYYLMSEADKQLTGTHIQAQNDKKIAVYCGVPLTNLPTDIAARDCLFEQSMPTEYWGTQFIVTRSLEKNGNLIGITATNKGTEIKVDGYPQATINEGETFYMMLQSSNDPNGNKPGTSPIDLVVTADVAYIETSCPCAVYNYDTGNSYKGKNGDEIKNSQGDPSSIWVSPIQQKINAITFGTCYTTKTDDHFLNVVTETATCNETKLTAIYGATGLDKSSLLTWIPVPGNSTYSYARAKIGDSSTSQYSVFRLENPRGVLATVYGNGNDESYAYSAGSAAVEQAVNVDGFTFSNGYKSDEKFCMFRDLEFVAQGGADEVSRVDWDFDDGTTQTNGKPQAKHTYTSPGWYNVSAMLYGHQVCTDESEQFLGSVAFTFRVVRQDTVIDGAKHDCILLDDYKNATPEQKAKYDKLIAEGENDTIPVEFCYDTIHIRYMQYGMETEEELDTIKGDDSAVGYNGITYYSSTDVIDTTTNASGCYHFRKYHVRVITCLAMSVNNEPEKQRACPGENIKVSYNKVKGDIDGNAVFKVDGLDEIEIPISNDNGDGTIELPVEAIKTPGHYKATLSVKDLNCEQTFNFPVDFTVYYPTDIFKYKFNNVLAVYNPGYGGNKKDRDIEDGDASNGWVFTAYQWFLNGEAIDSVANPTAVTPVYHTEAPFNEGDEYYVELTDQRGNKLQSCARTIDSVPPIEPKPAQAPAQKVIINNRMVIRLDGRDFNIYGQRVQ